MSENTAEKIRHLVRDAMQGVDALLAEYDALRLERDRLQQNYAPHMCRMGHQEIRHFDGEHEQCPLCRAIAKFSMANRAKRRACADERSRVLAEVRGWMFEISTDPTHITTVECWHGLMARLDAALAETLKPDGTTMLWDDEAGWWVCQAHGCGMCLPVADADVGGNYLLCPHCGRAITAWRDAETEETPDDRT